MKNDTISHTRGNASQKKKKIQKTAKEQKQKKFHTIHANDLLKGNFVKS